jgi:beta-glucosidase
LRSGDRSPSLFIDYCAFDAIDITPGYEVGLGLTYTTFNYSLIQCEQTNKTIPQYPPDATTGEGGNPRLWDGLVTVNATVQNNGTVDGFEVAQLYLGIPNGPIRQLRGFEMVFIC